MGLRNAAHKSSRARASYYGRSLRWNPSARSESTVGGQPTEANQEANIATAAALSKIPKGSAPAGRNARQDPNVEIAFVADIEGDAVRLAAEMPFGMSRSWLWIGTGFGLLKALQNLRAREPPSRLSSPTTASSNTASARSRCARHFFDKSRGVEAMCKVLADLAAQAPTA